MDSNGLINKYNSLSPDYRKLITIYALSFMLLVIIAGSRKYFGSNAFDIVDTCLLKTPKNMINYIKVGRGSNYYINNSLNIASADCLVTGWAISHIVLYMILGFVVPNMFWETFFIGALFEVAEYMLYNCHDILDVVWNSIGFIIGMTLNKLVNKNKNK